MPRVVSVTGRDRRRAEALKNADLFRELEHFAGEIARAINEDDGILGSLASQGFINTLAEFPADLRADFRDALSDEAAAALRADRLYLEAHSGPTSDEGRE